MNIKRMRGRNHRGGGGGGTGGGGPVRHQTGNVPLNRNHVFDSSGPDLRVRGTSQQLSEKYLQLGRDATSSGDRVMAESYFQHAEHYFRILNAMNQAAQPQGQPGGQPAGQQRRQNQDQPGGEGGNEYRGVESQNNGDTQSRADESDGQDETPGMGEQPGAEMREISITASPPER